MVKRESSISEVIAASARAGDTEFARFFAAIYSDPAAHAALGAIEIPEDYARVAAELAAARSIAVDAATIAAATHPDPLGLSRFAGAPVTLATWPERGWLPARAIATGAAPAFDWAWLGSDSLTAPFYLQDARRAEVRPFSRMFRTRTTLDAVVAGAASAEAREPDGLVFHMSRCGSTLVAQMLAAVPHHVVASEPEPLDAVVQWATVSGAPLEAQVAAVRAIAAAIGRDRSGDARRYFLKLDCWHACALPLFRAAFPDVPWIFLYRDPTEVMVSQMRSRGVQTVPGLLPPHIFDIVDGDTMPAEDYCAEVLARTCAAALEHRALGGGMLVNYAELPDAMDRIAAHFGFVPDADEVAAMAAVRGRYSKAPHEGFAADGARKRAEASATVRQAVATRLAPVYDRLEAARNAG